MGWHAKLPWHGQHQKAQGIAWEDPVDRMVDAVVTLTARICAPTEDSGRSRYRGSLIQSSPAQRH